MSLLPREPTHPAVGMSPLCLIAYRTNSSCSRDVTPVSYRLQNQLILQYGCHPCVLSPTEPTHPAVGMSPLCLIAYRTNSSCSRDVTPVSYRLRMSPLCLTAYGCHPGVLRLENQFIRQYGCHPCVLPPTEPTHTAV